MKAEQNIKERGKIMKKLKIRILGIVAICAILTVMAGIASADPCPDFNAVKKANSYGAVVASKSGSDVTYTIAGMSGVSAQGLCIYEPFTIKNTLSQVGTNAFNSWKLDPHKGNHEYFEWQGDGTQRIAPGDPSSSGTANFADMASKIDISAEIYVLKIYDPTGAVCGTIGTCWAYPGPGGPVPELSTIILTTSGLLGLVLVTRKHNSK